MDRGGSEALKEKLVLLLQVFEGISNSAGTAGGVRESAFYSFEAVREASHFAVALQ